MSFDKSLILPYSEWRDVKLFNYQKADDKVFIRKFSKKNVKSKLYLFEKT